MNVEGSVGQHLPGQGPQSPISVLHRNLYRLNLSGLGAAERGKEGRQAHARRCPEDGAGNLRVEAVYNDDAKVSVQARNIAAHDGVADFDYFWIAEERSEGWADAVPHCQRVNDEVYAISAELQKTGEPVEGPVLVRFTIEGNLGAGGQAMCHEEKRFNRVDQHCILWSERFTVSKRLI